MEFTNTIEINAPREKVYFYLTDEEKTKVWVLGMGNRIYPEGFDKENPVGQPYIQQIKEGGRMTDYTATLLELKEPETVTIQMAGKSFTMVMTYRLKDNNGKTQVEATVSTIITNRIVKFLVKLFAGFTKKLSRKQLQSLKREVEKG